MDLEHSCGFRGHRSGLSWKSRFSLLLSQALGLLSSPFLIHTGMGAILLSLL